MLVMTPGLKCPSVVAEVKVSYTAGGWPLISPGLGSRCIHFRVTAKLLPPPRIHCNNSGPPSAAHFPRVHWAQFPRVQCGQSRDGGADSSSIPGPGPGHQAPGTARRLSLLPAYWDYWSHRRLCSTRILAIFPAKPILTIAWWIVATVGNFARIL